MVIKQLVLVTGLAIVGEITHADTTVKEEYTYYDVAVDSKNNLVRSINAASPIRKSGDGYYGLSLIDIKWSVAVQASDKYCQIAKIDLNVGVKYTLPKLVSNSSEVMEIWSSWYPNLVKHELGHKEIGLAAVSEIERKTMLLPSEKTCEELTLRLNQMLAQSISDLDVAQTKYDQETDFGKTQGVDLDAFITPHLR